MSATWGELSPSERLRDVLFACIVIGGAIFIQMQLAGGAALFSRDFWIDEVLTYRIASDPDFLHSLRAVQAGIDLSPPGYQVLVRGWTIVFGLSETSLRGFAFATMMVCFVGLYLVLRLSAGRVVCCAAVLALWSHPVILQEAFDARFYTPWLAAIVWYCFFWQMAKHRMGSYWAYAGLAICSLLTCSFHYFGIVSLALVVAGELLLNRLTIKAATPLLIASTMGPLALCFYVPVFWMHQISISQVSWIPDPSLTLLARFLVKLLFPAHLSAVVLVSLISFWLQRDDRAGGNSALQNRIDSSTGLISLITMIPLLIAVSYLGKSVLVPRYAIPAVACVAPAVVIGLRGVGRYGAIALIFAFSIAGCVGIAFLKQSAMKEAATFREQIAAVEKHTNNQAVFFESSNGLLISCHYAPHLAQRCFFLKTNSGELPWIDANRGRVFSRAHSSVFFKLYPNPRPHPWRELRKATVFYLVLDEAAESTPPVLSSQHYPGFVGQQIEGRLYLMRHVASRAAD